MHLMQPDGDVWYSIPAGLQSKTRRARRWTVTAALQVMGLVSETKFQRYHVSLNNLTPADDYLGRAKEVQARREETKQKMLERRRLQHQLVLLQEAGVS